MTETHYRAAMRVLKFTLAAAATVYLLAELFTHPF
jgi:hypothetical protein